jgi:CHASE2 domain-containing sensor protein
MASAANNPPDMVTWQPREGVRIAAVVVSWQGGTVLAGRSLAQVEIRENNALLIAVAAWLATLVALTFASLAAAWLWPVDRGI